MTNTGATPEILIGEAPAEGDSRKGTQAAKEPGSALARRYLYAIAFVVGAVVMAAEISAGRLVAPYFGTSSPVWASPPEGSPVLTDDRAPVEILTDRIVIRSLLGGRS